MAIDRLNRRFSEAQRDELPARQSTYPKGDGYIGARLKTGEWLRSGHLFTISHAIRTDAKLCATFFR